MESPVAADANASRSPELDHLGALLMRLGSRSFAFFGAVATELGLPPPVAMALQRIDPARPGPMHELAGAMGCDPSYVTWLADQLEARGFGERQSASHDRRVKVLALTPAGVAVREQLLGRLAQVPFPLEQLSRGEAASLSELLARLLDVRPAAGADLCPPFASRPPVLSSHSAPASAPALSGDTSGGQG